MQPSEWNEREHLARKEAAAKDYRVVKLLLVPLLLAFSGVLFLAFKVGVEEFALIALAHHQAPAEIESTHQHSNLCALTYHYLDSDGERHVGYAEWTRGAPYRYVGTEGGRAVHERNPSFGWYPQAPDGNPPYCSFPDALVVAYARISAGVSMPVDLYDDLRRQQIWVDVSIAGLFGLTFLAVAIEALRMGALFLRRILGFSGRGVGND